MAAISATKASEHVTRFDNSFAFSFDNHNVVSTPAPKLKTENLASFPDRVDSQLCWTPATFQKLGTQEIVVELSSSDILAMEHALAYFRNLGIAIPLIRPENFPLPQDLTVRLQKLDQSLHEGIGFGVLRGLKADKYTEEDDVILFCGISCHVGFERSTNAFGMSLDHIRSAAKDIKPADREHFELAPSKLAGPLKFHADRHYGDVIALHVKSHAAVGGQQFLASFWTIYNDLMHSSPVSLNILAGDWPWPGVINDEPATEYAPILFHHEGKIFCQLVYRPFEGNNLLSKDQIAALEALEASAQRNCIELKSEVGDIQFFNNLALVHARSTWIDRPNKSRHYLRLGLRSHRYGWAKPQKHSRAFEGCFETQPDQQTIPTTDFDPWLTTTLGFTGHG